MQIKLEVTRRMQFEEDLIKEILTQVQALGI
jgi:hypothetical protein